MKKVEQKSNGTRTYPIVGVKNALTEWYELKKNEIDGQIEVRNKGEDVEYKPLNYNNLRVRLLSNGHNLPDSDLRALLDSEFVPSYNPFQNYFDSLPTWTINDEDYIELIANHVIALDQNQFNLHFKKMLVRTIACALDNHFFNKHAFILVGGTQNTGKSTFCRYLCPIPLDKYFTETIPNDKDGLISLCENFIINLDELSTLSKFELNHLKSLFSKDKVRVRHPYAHKTQTDPRRASFIGSTNEETFLTDTTGNVRWLCFEISGINWSYKEISIDKAWSQAYSLYKQGFQFQLSPEELEKNNIRNRQFQHTPMEYDLIRKYFSPGTEWEDDKFKTPTEILAYIVSQSDFRADIRSTEKIGKVLHQLGFQRVSKRQKGVDYPQWGYFVKFNDLENED